MLICDKKSWIDFKSFCGFTFTDKANKPWSTSEGMPDPF